jgi:rhodanese-related sulfurtransferase
MKMISPAAAKTLIAQGARLVDVRGADEFARSHIPGAVSMPLDQLSPLPGDAPVIFHCLTGNRTAVHKDKLMTAAPGAMVMEGGLQAWQAAGLAVDTKRGQPIEIMRQVQITAGSLVLLGVILSLVMPGFIWLSAFIGAGLVFAGASGWCGMAKALKFLPWNRVAG